MDEDSDDIGPPADRRDLEAGVLRILDSYKFYGGICSELAKPFNVTKEWMRRVLIDMERRGLVGHVDRGAFFMWYSREWWEKLEERWPSRR